jgi:enoyl-CoA hydratase/carnithine racemase
MTMPEPAYFTAFKNFNLSRTPSGVLTLRFHTDGGPVLFTGTTHTEFPRALYEIGEDRGNRVLVLTGSGDRFMTDMDGASLGDITKPTAASARGPGLRSGGTMSGWKRQLDDLTVCGAGEAATLGCHATSGKEGPR